MAEGCGWARAGRGARLRREAVVPGALRNRPPAGSAPRPAGGPPSRPAAETRAQARHTGQTCPIPGRNLAPTAHERSRTPIQSVALPKPCQPRYP